jgi:hypothetical protein
MKTMSTCDASDFIKNDQRHSNHFYKKINSKFQPALRQVFQQISGNSILNTAFKLINKNLTWIRLD